MTSHMYNPYEEWPLQFRLVADRPVPSVEGEVSCFGMGGSGIPCAIMSSFYNFCTDFRITGTLIAISVSGDTRETVSLVKKALDDGIRVVGITRGGTLLRILRERGQPVIPVLEPLSTRFVFPSLFTPLVKMLRPDLLPELVETPGDPSPLVNFLYSRIVTPEGHVKFPVFYSSRYPGIAERFKQEFNENAKLPAFHGRVPEILHNEVEADYPSDLFVRFYFTDGETDSEIARFLDAVPIPVSGIRDIPTLLASAGILTVKIAQLRNVNYLDIPRINELKKILRV